MTRLANFGFEDGIVDSDIGLNAKLPEWSAATALAVLDRYDDVLARRRTAAERMLGALTGHGYRRQSGSEGSAVAVRADPRPLSGGALQRRSTPLAANKSRCGPTSPFRCTGCPPSRAFRSPASLRCTDDLARRSLSLPMANDLSPDCVDAIVASVAAASRTTVP